MQSAYDGVIVHITIRCTSWSARSNGRDSILHALDHFSERDRRLHVQLDLFGEAMLWQLQLALPTLKSAIPLELTVKRSMAALVIGNSG
jgi:hypothetical protein